VITKIESGGLYWESESTSSRIQKIWLCADSDMVELKMELHSRLDAIDPSRYFTPVEAMAFAKAFERCAIVALKESA